MIPMDTLNQNLRELANMASIVPDCLQSVFYLFHWIGMKSDMAFHLEVIK